MHKKFFFLIFFLPFLLCFSDNTCAQKYKKNKYDLEIIDNINDYRAEINNNKQAKLTLLTKYVPLLKTRFVYATKRNFTHTVLYKHPEAYAVLPLAEALRKAAAELDSQGLGILLYDAYRPYCVTEKMWKIEPDARYAADPKFGSGHNRGIAVDIGLYKLSTGELLRMPTDFDNFTDTAHSDFMNLPQTVLANRQLLKRVMEKYGLKQLSTEWWHFYLPNNNYKILDLDFNTLNNFEKGKEAQ